MMQFSVDFLAGGTWHREHSEPLCQAGVETLARVGWVGELLQTPHCVSVFWSSAISVKWGLNEVLPCLEPIHAPIPRPGGALALIPCCHKQQLELVKLTSCLHNPFCQLRCYFPEEGCSPLN